MADGEPVPELVRPGWTTAWEILTDSARYRLLAYSDGEVRFEHECDRGARGVVLCAPAMPLHTITTTDAALPTVTPSILCPDCGTHGFVTEGQWVPAG